MTVHLLKPGTSISDVRLRCGSSTKDVADGDELGTEDSIANITCAGCLRDLIVDMRIERQGAVADSAEDRWLAGGDTGTSSLTIWSVMTGRPMPRGRRPDVPHDPSDFGRCHRLLEVFPAWRERMQEVAERYPEWRGLVLGWDEIEAQYLAELPSGHAPRCWALMREACGDR